MCAIIYLFNQFQNLLQVETKSYVRTKGDHIIPKALSTGTIIEINTDSAIANRSLKEFGKPISNISLRLPGK